VSSTIRWPSTARNSHSDELVWKQTVKRDKLALWVEVVPWGTSRLESRWQVVPAGARMWCQRGWEWHRCSYMPHIVVDACDVATGNGGSTGDPRRWCGSAPFRRACGWLPRSLPTMCPPHQQSGARLCQTTIATDCSPSSSSGPSDPTMIIRSGSDAAYRLEAN
jgi:hypothetical protein